MAQAKQGRLFDVLSMTLKADRDLKTIKAMIADALLKSALYQKAKEENDKTAARLREVRGKVLLDLANDLDRMDILKADKMSNDQLLNDLALSLLTKEGKIDIVDIDGIEYEPIFKVKFIPAK